MYDDSYYQQIKAEVQRTSLILEEDWNLLYPLLRYSVVKKGDYFCRAGDISRDIAFVLQGVFRAYYIVNGEEVNCQFYLENQWVKVYHSFLSRSSSQQWVQALEDAQVFLLSYDAIQQLFTSTKNWERFGRIAAENAYITAQVRSESLLLDKPEARYVNLLHTYSHIFDRVPLYHIASYLGITQPSLSRIRRRLLKKASSSSTIIT
jgi:CRP-like cAMP-binding protein